MRLIYSFFLYLLSPLILLYLKKRGRKNAAYNKNWQERFGFNLKNHGVKPIIWLHAVSVGETRALQKLIALLEHDYPHYQILITNMTPTGRATAQELYPNVITHYIPYDLPHAVISFYKTFKPHLGLIMETEIWPNLAFYARKFALPLYLVNARLSSKSFTSYNKIHSLIKPILNNFSGILCQDQNSRDNFMQLGYTNDIAIIGNMKFDLLLKHDFASQALPLKAAITKKKSVVFASTRAGDEKLILDNLPANFPYLIIIVPRHPERFNLVENLIQEKNLKYQKRSDSKIIFEDTQIFLGNSLGEMLFYYTICDLAIIGGSFNNHGGQNPIEAIFMHKPVIFGPSMFNFKEVAKNALHTNCAIAVADINDCFIKISSILENNSSYLDLVENCQRFIQTYQGASQLVFDTVTKHLP